MRAVIQRVYRASVEVDGEIVGQVERGLLVYVGIAPHDTPAEADWLAAKIATLRIFEDDAGKLNRSVLDIGGAVLAISNFTLLADARKGRRPAFNSAAAGEEAEPLMDAFVESLIVRDVPVQTGRFAAEMTIRSDADGPVNLVIDKTPD